MTVTQVQRCNRCGGFVHRNVQGELHCWTCEDSIDTERPPKPGLVEYLGTGNSRLALWMAAAFVLLSLLVRWQRCTDTAATITPAVADDEGR